MCPCHLCPHTQLFLLMPDLTTAAPPASHYRVSLHGPNANTARSESRHTHWPRAPENASASGKQNPSPLASLSPVLTRTSRKSGPDFPGGAQRAGSSPGAKAVRHPPCQTEETEKSCVTVCKDSKGAGRAPPRARVLLPVKGIQRTEDDAAHGVVPPEEEPVGTRERATVRPWPAPRGDTAGRGRLRFYGVWREEQSVHSSQVDRHATLGKDILGRAGPREENCHRVKRSSVRREVTAQFVGQEQTEGTDTQALAGEGV